MARDGLIVGMERDGQVIQYNAETQDLYACGERVEEFGINNVTNEELLVLVVSAGQVGRKLDEDFLKRHAHARGLIGG
jgi:hypothetical protein